MESMNAFVWSIFWRLEPGEYGEYEENEMDEEIKYFVISILYFIPHTLYLLEGKRWSESRDAGIELDSIMMNIFPLLLLLLIASDTEWKKAEEEEEKCSFPSNFLHCM